MGSGGLLQTEILIALQKQDPNDPLFDATQKIFSSSENDLVPTISTIGYGLARSAIIAADLPRRQTSELSSRLRTYRRELDEGGRLFSFDLDCADEWAIVRQTCKQSDIALTAELQLEYAIALAKRQVLLAPASAKSKYLSYPSLKIEFL